MPPKANPRDWDRHFRPDAPRRGGPLRVLINLIVLCIALGILGGAGFFAWQYRNNAVEHAQQQETARAQSNATSTVVAAGAIATRTAQAMQVKPTAAVATTPTAVPEPIIGQAVVTNGGNLRREPLVVAETVIGQLCVDDQVDLLEERNTENGARWYRLRVTSAPTNCVAERVAIGTTGWFNATLLKPLTP